jgi:SAM-dependent methyltransferase
MEMADKAILLKQIVKNEGMLWGNDVADAYHGAAAADMNDQWKNIIGPVFARHNFDLSDTMDFACGYGRNAKKLREAGAQRVTLVDVNPDNVAYCKVNLVPLGGYDVFQNNGYDLDGLPSGRFSHVYSFDAMVHFDLEIVISYVTEFARVMKPGAMAFIHHSNYTDNPGGSFRDTPHWRNFMSATIFKHISMRHGLEVLEQNIIDWGAPAIDCISVLRKPYIP